MNQQTSVVAMGFQHIGVPVRSMERSLDFYRGLFGVEPEFIVRTDDPNVERLTGVPAAEVSFAFVRIGAATLELIEYHSPPGRDFDRRNNDVGAIHIAFEVDDIEAFHAAVVERGIEVSSAPSRSTDGPVAGYASFYFKDPDGIQLEAVEVPRAGEPR